MTENARLRARRRAELLDAARSLFLQHGVDAVTVEQITEQAAVTRRTFYRYFPSRDHVALAIEAEILDGWAARAEQARAGLTGTGAELLAGYLRRGEKLVDEAADEIGFTRVFDATALGVLDTSSAEGAAYVSAIRRLHAPLVEILRQGFVDGTLSAVAPAELAAATITNALLGLAQRVQGRGQAIAAEQDVAVRAMLTTYLELVCRGLAAPRA